MPFVVKQSLIEKSFCKIGQSLGENLDLTSPNAPVDFMAGLVESLRKDAHMNPSQALGFIKYITEIGFSEAKLNKTASVEEGNELDAVFDKMNEKLAGLMLKSAEGTTLGWNPINWVPNAIKMHGEAAGRGATDNIENQIGSFATKAWDHLKSPEFLRAAAPYAIGALGGYLIPKLFGDKGNGLVNAGLGAAAVGGGALLANKYNLMDPETWKKFKDEGMKFIGGNGQNTK